MRKNFNRAILYSHRVFHALAGIIMKLFVKLLISVLVIGVLLPFTILKGSDGKPLLSFNDLQSPELPKFPGGIIPSSASLESKDVIYKWTDAEGILQYSNSVPPEGVEFAVMDYDPNQNVIQAVGVNADEPEVVLESDPKKEVTSVEDIGNPYSAENIKKLFEGANNIEKLLIQRLNNQEAVSGQ